MKFNPNKLTSPRNKWAQSQPHAFYSMWPIASRTKCDFCGVYYPVSVLPAPLQVVAAAVPLTHFLEAFRAQLGYAPVFKEPLVRGYVLAVVYAAGGYALFAWAIQRARRTGMLLKLSD